VRKHEAPFRVGGALHQPGDASCVINGDRHEFRN
jgi:hypothetical protein